MMSPTMHSYPLQQRLEFDSRQQELVISFSILPRRYAFSLDSLTLEDGTDR